MESANPLIRLRFWPGFSLSPRWIFRSLLGCVIAGWRTRLCWGHCCGGASLRETSTVFAALIGWFILGEKVGPRRLALMALIALGAVIVELGGRG